jgi:hypothetical protein
MNQVDRKPSSTQSPYQDKRQKASKSFNLGLVRHSLGPNMGRGICACHISHILLHLPPRSLGAYPQSGGFA